jgi:RHS repeat-associated protein
MERSGESRGNFTGERWEAYSELLFLRARYYEPGNGRFLTRDSWEGDVNFPQTLHPNYLYTLNGPVNATDPTGQRSEHAVTQIWYGFNYWLIPEYRIPGTAPAWMPPWAKKRNFWWGSRVDLLDPWVFEIYEVEPREGANRAGHGLEQITRYIQELNAAQAFFVDQWAPGTRVDTGEHSIPWDLVYDLHFQRSAPGLILYWKEPNISRAKVLVELVCFEALRRMIVEGTKGLLPSPNPAPAPSVPAPVFPFFPLPPGWQYPSGFPPEEVQL